MKTQRADLDALIVWALATFHASLFLLVALLFLYWQDVLRHMLPNLNTAVGLGLFVILWSTTWWTTRLALAGVTRDADVIRRAVRWGGVNGVLFLSILIAGAGVSAALGEPAQLFGALFGVFFFLVIGSLFAFAIGGVVGTVLGLIDVALLRTARGLVVRATDYRLTDKMRSDRPSE
jgi:hypothetical protein